MISDIEAGKGPLHDECREIMASHSAVAISLLLVLPDGTIKGDLHIHDCLSPRDVLVIADVLEDVAAKVRGRFGDN